MQKLINIIGIILLQNTIQYLIELTLPVVVDCLRTFSIWRWSQHGPLKYWGHIILHNITTQKTMTWIFITMEISNIASLIRQSFPSYWVYI